MISSMYKTQTHSDPNNNRQKKPFYFSLLDTVEFEYHTDVSLMQCHMAGCQHLYNHIPV